LELAFWESIKDSDDRRNFEAYIEQYPDGSFSAIARLRIEAPETVEGALEGGDALLTDANDGQWRIAMNKGHSGNYDCAFSRGEVVDTLTFQVNDDGISPTSSLWPSDKSSDVAEEARLKRDGSFSFGVTGEARGYGINRFYFVGNFMQDTGSWVVSSRHGTCRGDFSLNRVSSE
jgi:hypothetical protein